MRLQHLDEVKTVDRKIHTARDKAGQIRRQLNALPERIAALREELAEARAAAEVEGGGEGDDHIQEIRDQIAALRSKREDLTDDLAAAEKVVELRKEEKERAIRTAMERVREEVRPKVRAAIKEALQAWERLREANAALRDLESDYRPLDRDANQGSRRFERVLPTGPGYYQLALDVPAALSEWAQGLERAQAALATPLPEGTPDELPGAGASDPRHGTPADPTGSDPTGSTPAEAPA